MVGKEKSLLLIHLDEHEFWRILQLPQENAEDAPDLHEHLDRGRK